jgi:hypothetical protein
MLNVAVKKGDTQQQCIRYPHNNSMVLGISDTSDCCRDLCGVSNPAHCPFHRSYTGNIDPCDFDAFDVMMK